MGGEAKRAGWRGWGAFALLCVLAASRWIVADQWPVMGSTLRSEAMACGLGAMMAAVVALARGRAWGGGRAMWGLGVVGAGLLGAPALGAALRGPAGQSFNRTLALCFVPIVVTVLCNAMGRESATAKLWPGLAGLAAGLLLFPVEMPMRVGAYVGLLVPVVAVAWSCFAFARVGKDVATEWKAAALLGGGFVCLVAIEAWRVHASGDAAQVISWIGVAVDAVVAGLTVAAVCRLSALQYASRYFVVPLVTVLEGLAIFRPRMSLRFGVGLLLLVIATVGLWRRCAVAGTGLRLSD